MATTITATELSVNITESITLNGSEYGNSISKSFSTLGEVDQRIMNITQLNFESGGTEIIKTSTEDGRGTVVANDWAYFRITNLDDTNFITLRFVSATDAVYIKIEAGESFMLMSPDFDIESSPFGGGTFADIRTIAAASDTAACDIEYVIATA